MKTSIALITIATTLGGCGGFYQPNATAILDCQEPQCGQLWSQAQAWLATNSAFRIQLVNDTVIQTYGPSESDPTSVGYTLTKQLKGDGTGRIVIRSICSTTIYGCVVDPAPEANKLYYHLGGT